jgi:hypothetical protein
MITDNNILIWYNKKIYSLLSTLGITKDQKKDDPLTHPEPGTSSTSPMEETMVTSLASIDP